METPSRPELHHAAPAAANTDVVAENTGDIAPCSLDVASVDVVVVGAGIIGLSLALELKARGLQVLILEQGKAMREASWAAAGMLAALDPSNPDDLQPLARLSLALYPQFLARIASLTGHHVRLRTATTLLGAADNPETSVVHRVTPATEILSAEAIRHLAPLVAPGPYRWALLEEPSLDPRDLCQYLPQAAQALRIEMREHTAWLSTTVLQNQADNGRKLQILTSKGTVFTNKIVHCTGAWSGPLLPAAKGAAGLYPNAGLRPRKGQMLCLRLPAGCELHCVVHTPGCYIVPRGDGRVIIGATIEDCGFDKTLHPAAIDDLRHRAELLVPVLCDAEEVERWAGLRPGSPDNLPVLGSLPGAPGSYIAAGHFRMGILLAPATARVMTQVMLNEPPPVDIKPFSPERFIRNSLSRPHEHCA